MPVYLHYVVGTKYFEFVSLSQLSSRPTTAIAAGTTTKIPLGADSCVRGFCLCTLTRTKTFTHLFSLCFTTKLMKVRTEQVHVLSKMNHQ